MDEEVKQHVIYNVVNTPFVMYPFPHFYVENVFPDDFYKQLLKKLPEDKYYNGAIESGRIVNVPKGTKDTRFVFSLINEDVTKLAKAKKEFWEEIQKFFFTGEFASAIVQKFNPLINARFQNQDMSQVKMRLNGDLLRDKNGYSLGPHTDLPSRVLNIFFYLAKDDKHQEHGTAIYVPKDKNFRCPGGPHHDFNDFIKVRTMAYKPNSMCAFFKTDQSFHGVEPIQSKSKSKAAFKRDAMAFYVQQL